MYKRMLAGTLICLVVLSFAGCKKADNLITAETTAESRSVEPKSTESESTEPTVPETEETEAVKKSEAGVLNVSFKPGFNSAGTPYKPLEFTAMAPDYSVTGDLSDIANIDQYGNLTEQQRALIAQNGFVVIPTDSEQLFYIYEDNTYKKIPSFVTTDSVLQLYHIFYDYSLRSLETDFFYHDTLILNEQMIGQLMNEYSDAQNPDMKSSALKMVGYFGVAQLALGEPLPAGFPDELKDVVNQEYRLIENARGVEKSPLFGYEIDYSLFTVRGHYTRSQELGKYFRGMSWYGIVPMPFYNDQDKKDEQSAMRAIVTTLALCRLPEDKGIKLWENIYSTTSFYVGESDDVTPYEVAAAITKVYSDAPDIDEIPEKLDEFFLEVDKFGKAQIIQKVDGAVVAPQMRFMGQRYIPDSEILQNLSEPMQRPSPTGVDIFAVYGSPRAEEVLAEFYQPNEKWSGYQGAFNKMADKFRSQTIPEQTNNLYNGWLYCLKSLTTRPADGYPMFMKNKAWEDKSLSTALGSWAEIRHDTILYGKQSGAECGGSEDEPPELLGYVEPNPEFFNRLLWLTNTTKVNLEARELLNLNMQHKLEHFEEMLLFLRTCAEKELRGENLSAEEQYSLLTYGGTLEYLSSSIAEASDWFLVESDTDKNMALIADIHTNMGTYLEAGVGTASEIYVAIPQNGNVYLTRGAVFDFFEFHSNIRLTDEAWQAQIKQAPPARPPFTGSYLDEESGNEVPTPESPYSTGC